MKNSRIIIFFIFIVLCIINLQCKTDKSGITNSTPINTTDYEFNEPPITGKTFYIDPVQGTMDGDGSSENPWRTLQEVIDSSFVEYYRPSERNNPDSELEVINAGAPIKGGDNLVLRNGYHGYVKLNCFMFKEWITIQSENGHHPILSQFRIEGAFEKIYLKNITILKESYEGDGNYWEVDVLNRNSGACLRLSSSDFWGKGSHIKLSGLTIKTAENTSSWSDNDWIEKSAGGISLRSVTYCEIVNCTIENVNTGMAIEYFSDNTNVVNNTINNYSCDGVRIISNDVYFAYNTITNCYDVDDNHDDAIQSYTRGADNSPGTGVLSNVVLRGNLIIGAPNTNNPLAGNPQGIGCFDGIYDNWIVENNVVITDHYHGISFYGMSNSTIVNNTVIDEVPNNNTCPWIRINPHKNDTESRNCVIANNIVSSSIITSGTNVTEYNNFVFGTNNYNQIYMYFIDPDNYDFHLLDNDSTRKYIIDKGKAFQLTSTTIDRDQNARKSLPDLGAYEIQ